MDEDDSLVMAMSGLSLLVYPNNSMDPRIDKHIYLGAIVNWRVN